MDLSVIQACLRAGIEARAVRVGPFLVAFDPHIEKPFRNYAISNDGAQPTAQVDRLVAGFTKRRRTPRLEYVGRPPAVESAPAAAGFTADRRLPLVTADQADLVAPPLPAGIELRTAESDADLWRAAAVQNAAYGEAELAEADVDRLRPDRRGRRRGGPRSHRGHRRGRSAPACTPRRSAAWPRSPPSGCSLPTAAAASPPPSRTI